MLKWKRPSGTEIETADTEAIREYASKEGWKLKECKEAVTDDNSTTDSKRSSRTRNRKNR